MVIYCTPYVPIRRPQPLLDLMPAPRRERIRPGQAPHGPLMAYALCDMALRRHYGLSAREHICYTDTGKPYIPGNTVHMSLSHGKTHALCALADLPVGADIETHRQVAARTIHRTLASEEDPAAFFDYWVLKESYIKLRGELDRPYPGIAFSIRGDSARGMGTWGHLFRDIPGCTAALLAPRPTDRPPLILVPGSEVLAWAENPACNRGQSPV